MDHSVWLRPEPGARAKIQASINRFASERNMQVFKAHMTLIGDLAGALQPTIDACNSLAPHIKPFQATVASVDCSDDFFKAVYLRLEVELSRQTLAQYIPETLVTDDRVFRHPHISIAYGASDAGVREQITGFLEQALLGYSFQVDELAIVRSAVSIPIDEWKILYKMKLGATLPG